MKFFNFFCGFLLLNVDVQSQKIDIFQLIDFLTSLNLDPEILTNLAKINLTDFNIGQICDFVNDANDNVSSLCIKQVKIVCRDVDFLTRMMDASSKFPYAGILSGTRLDYGNFEECTALETQENGIRVLGKHCTAGFVIPMTSLPENFVMPDKPDFVDMGDYLEKAFKLSTCTPDGCSSSDLMHLLNIPSRYPVFNEMLCTTKEYCNLMEWDCIAVLSFLLFMIFVMAISTGYDLYKYFSSTKPYYPILLGFSVFSNGKKLLKTTNGQNKEQILVFHGLKAISIMWISAGHCFSAFTFISVDNHESAYKWQWSRKASYITSSHLAVDTFFFISGFLCAYHYLKAKENKPLHDHLKSFPFMVFHRFLRLAPALLVTYMVFTSCYRYLGTGPAYKAVGEFDTKNCNTYWWSLLLFVQNYVNYKEICMIQTWYLAADMQLFLITPVILIPISFIIKKHFGWTMIQLTILNLLATMVPIALKMIFSDFENEYETHARINVYLTGIMLGIFMRERSDLRYKFCWVANLLIWSIVLISMVIIVLAYKEIQLLAHEENDKKYTTYFILLRGLWGIGLSWIVYSSHNGHGGIVSWFLTRPVFQILSKLTYSIYLVHIMVIAHFIISIQTRIHFSSYLGISVWISGFVLSTIVAVFWTLAFESPIIIIEKFVFGKANKSREQVKPTIKTRQQNINFVNDDK